MHFNSYCRGGGVENCPISGIDEVVPRVPVCMDVHTGEEAVEPEVSGLRWVAMPMAVMRLRGVCGCRLALVCCM